MKRLNRVDRAGFTLVEVAVALVIVAIGMTLCLQSLQTAKMQAAQTRNYKLARELGVMTLGQIESGLYQEDMQSGFQGTYAEEGYPEFTFDLRLGEEAFEEEDYSYSSDEYYDSFAARRQRQLDEALDAGEDEDEIEEPFEKVKIRISFPRVHQYRNYLDIESWFVWKQVYGEDESEDSETPPESP